MRTGRPAAFATFPRNSVPVAVVLSLLTVAAAAEDFDAGKLPPAARGPVDFTRQVQPLLDNHCLKCHSEERPKSHFRLTSREAALQGGENGVDIIPGNSARSPLIYYVARLVADMEMPPEGRGTPLTPKEVGLLRAWIDEGLPWPPGTNNPATELAVSPVVGWTTVDGNARKFRELFWQPDGWNGGLEGFDAESKPGPGSRVRVAGHVLRDDYQLSLTATKDDLGFTRFGWEQFRKYFDDTGGYNGLLAGEPVELNRDLFLDVGRAWADVGLTLPGLPTVVLGYEQQYRDGTESTLQWGPVSNGRLTNNVYPGFKAISERVHILKLDTAYELGGAQLSDDFRGEWYRLGTQVVNDSGFTLGAPGAEALTTANEQQSSFSGANTFHVEKQFTDWLFGAGGYLYSQLNASGSDSVENGSVGFLSMPSVYFPGYPGYQAERIQLELESHVFSLSARVGPWKGLSLNLGTQNEWTRETGLTTANVSIAMPLGIFPVDLESLYSDLDRRSFSQDVGFQYTSLPFTTIYGSLRLQEETLGQFQQEAAGLTPFLERAEAQSRLQDARVGFDTSPWQRVSVTGEVRRYDDSTDYAYPLKVVGPPDEGYPAFIQARDLLSNQAEGKLALQVNSWLKTSLSYEWLENQYRTTTAPVQANPFTGTTGISPGGQLLAGEYQTHLTSLNATFTPGRRLFLSTSFSFQNARTVTWANHDAAVAPYAGNIYSATVNATYALNQATSLTAGYSLSRGDFAQANAAAGLPLGIDYWQHTLQAGLRRRLGQGKTVTVQYQFYHYEDPSQGGFDNFTAHGIFATFVWAFP